MSMPQHAEAIRVLIACADGAEGKRIAALLEQQPALRVVGVVENGIDACQMAVQLAPNVALLDEQLPELDGMAAAETICLAAPQVAILLLSNDPTKVLRQAMRVGVKEVVGKPATEGELAAALRTLRAQESKRLSQEFQALLDPQLMPRVVAVAGAKGGIGKTTLATNLAVALAQKHPGETVLIDLYSQFGDIALMLNLQPQHTMLEMLPVVSDIDEDLVQAHLCEHSSGLRVLVSSQEPVQLDVLNAGFLGTVLNTLKRRYRFVVLDVPPLLYEATTYILTHATAVLLVVNLFDLTTLNDTRKLYQTLQARSVPPERLHLVLNRMDRRNKFQGREIERVFGKPAAMVIPNESGIVVGSVNKGMPFVLSHPQAAISRSIGALADKVANGVQ